MTARVKRYSSEELARRGKDIYSRVVRPTLSEEDVGKFVTVDIESEDFEVDRDDGAALDRLYARRPDAQPWVERVGYVAAYSFRGALPRRTEL